MDITLCLTHFKTLDVETYYKFKTMEEKYEDLISVLISVSKEVVRKGQELVLYIMISSKFGIKKINFGRHYERSVKCGRSLNYFYLVLCCLLS